MSFEREVLKRLRKVQVDKEYQELLQTISLLKNPKNKTEYQMYLDELLKLIKREGVLVKTIQKRFRSSTSKKYIWKHNECISCL